MTFDDYADSSASPEPVSPDEPSTGMRPGSGLRGRRGLLTSAAVALTGIAGISAAHAASAAVTEPALEKHQPAASSSFDPALWHRQDLLSDLRSWIEAQPGIENSGYVTNINDPDAGSTILVWHGPPNRIQQQIIDEARRRHIPISIQHRRHSMAGLQQAAKQLSAINSGTGVFQNFEVGGLAAFDTDFDGLTVIGDYIRPPAQGVPAADTALTQALTAKTGVAVRIEHAHIENL